MTTRTLLVTVAADEGSADLCVAADVPVFQLLPALLEHAVGSGADRGGVDHARWHLVDGRGRLVPPRATLAAAGVLDGEVLTVTRAVAPREAP